MKFSKKFLASAFIFLLSANSALAFSQDYIPDDPGVVYQTYFDLINIAPTWSHDISVNKQVVVAVLDSGIDLDHPDLVENIWLNPGEIPGDGIDNDRNSYIDDIHGWDFIDSDSTPEPEITEGYDFTAVNHGTVVAGIIAAERNNRGIVGVAPQAKIMPLKILNNKGSGNTLVLSQAIDYAVDNGADIINLSLVGTTFDNELRTSLKNAYDAGVVIVAASGNQTNEGVDLDGNPRYPVCDIDSVNRVFGVAAVDGDLVLAPFSNYGEGCIDISAPGSKFYSTVFQSNQAEELLRYYQGGWNGTSVAAPIISATAALLKMNYPDLRPYDIYEIITRSAASLQTANPELYTDLGSGLIDVGAALNYAATYRQPGIKIILAPESGLSPEILILNKEGILLNSWLAYGNNFKGGVNIAVADMNNDGSDDVVTAAGPGGGPHVRVFSQGGVLLSQFFAYTTNFTGGVNVITADVDNDGEMEIITSPMGNGGPHVKIFNMFGDLKAEFFAYEANFYGGINIAAADINNDGLDEIIVAPASGYIPQVRVFDNTGLFKSAFLAYGVDYTSGVNISAGDANNDGWDEIITMPGPGFEPLIKQYSMHGRNKGEFMSHTRYLQVGNEVRVRDFTGDGFPEILSLPNKPGSSLLKIYDANGLEKDSLYLRNVADRNGYNFDIIRN